MKGRALIGALTALGFFGLIAASLFFPPTEAATIEVDDMLIGALTSAFIMIVAYYFRNTE